MRGAWRALAGASVGIGALVAPANVAGALGRPCAAGQIRVAIVVDHGDRGAPSVECVGAKSADNAATILATRASLLGLAQPRFNASGLLCAIDGIPADGCGVQHDGKYAYWAYFHGTNGSWSYSNIGPGGTRVSSGVVEGWRWEPAGSGLPNDPPPRAAASTGVCTPAPPPPPPPTGAPHVTTAGAATPLGSVPAGGNGPTTTADAARGATTRTTVAAARRNTRPKTGTTIDASSPTTAAPSERELAARATAERSHDGAPVGLIVGLLLVAILGVGGGIAARRRNRPVT